MVEIEQRKKKKEAEDKIDIGLEDVFKTYDRDCSHFLDRKETRKFIKDMLLEIGLDETIDDEEFEEIYNKFDLNHDGVLQKSELK
jgi:Ca2+-binding EF-hand superfamily protein